MASTTDLITGVRDGTARPVATTVTASRSAGGTTLTVAATTGWDTTTKVHFQTYTTDASGAKNTSSAADWSGIVSGTTITNLTLTAGTDNGNAIGDIVECMPTAAWADELAQGLLLEHEADGTHKAFTESNIVPTAAVQNSAITTAKVANDAITDDKLDYPRWYQEIARATLGTAGDTITVSSIPVRRYLRVIVGITTSGAVDAQLRFNNDSGSNYAYRFDLDNGTVSAPTNISQLAINPTGNAGTRFVTLDYLNIANQEKTGHGDSTEQGTAGAGNAPRKAEVTHKWANTTAAITRIDVFNNGGAGDFAAGSEVIVLGHD